MKSFPETLYSNVSKKIKYILLYYYRLNKDLLCVFNFSDSQFTLLWKNHQKWKKWRKVFNHTLFKFYKKLGFSLHFFVIVSYFLAYMMNFSSFIAHSASVNSKLKQIWHKNLKKIIIQPISPLGDVTFKVNRHATRLLNHTLFARKFLIRKKDEVTWDG